MSDSVTFTLAPVEADEERVKVYLPPELRDDFVDFMHSEGYETSELAEFAFGVDDVIIAFALVGGLKGLASVMEKYFARHQHKKVVVRTEETEYEVSGMSPQEMKAALGNVAAAVDQQQQKLNESWHRVLKESSDPPKQLPPDSESPPR